MTQKILIESNPFSDLMDHGRRQYDNHQQTDSLLLESTTEWHFVNKSSASLIIGPIDFHSFIHSFHSGIVRDVSVVNCVLTNVERQRRLENITNPLDSHQMSFTHDDQLVATISMSQTQTSLLCVYRMTRSTASSC